MGINFSKLTGEQKAMFVQGFIANHICSGAPSNDVLLHGTEDEKERMVQDLLLKYQTEQQKVSDQIAEDIIKAMVERNDREDDCTFPDTARALRSMLANVSCCKEDGGVYDGSKRLDNVMYVLPEGVSVPAWPAYMAVSNDGKNVIDSISYETLSNGEKKGYTKFPCISFEHEGEVIRITLKDKAYISRLIRLDIQRNPGVRFLYASKIGKAEESNFMLFDSTIIETLRELPSIIWSDAVVRQVENAEIGSVAQIYLAVLDSLDSMNDISQLKSEDIEECLPILELIIKEPELFTDEDLLSYSNNGQMFPGYLRNTVRRDNVTTAEQRDYVIIAVRNVINKLIQVAAAEKANAYDKDSVMHRLCTLVSASMPTNN